MKQGPVYASRPHALSHDAEVSKDLEKHLFLRKEVDKEKTEMGKGRGFGGETKIRRGV